MVYALDDDPLTLRSLAQMLGQEPDVECRTFTQVADLRAAAVVRRPDAVVVEVTLAGADGIQVTDELVRGDPDLVTLLVTSASDRDATADALSRVGPLRLMHKPFDAREVLPRLRAGLDRRRLAGDLAGARAALEHQKRALSATSSELATATERLVEAEQLAAVARVLNGVAHEITSQLALVGYAEAIRTRVAAEPELVELCDVIVAAHKRLVQMVDEVRAYVSQPGRGARLRREPADVVAVVDEALALLRYDRDVRARTVVKHYRARPLAALDREKFSQVVINLVSNAVLATRPGDAIEIELDSDDAAGALTLTVSDKGAGMPPSVLARLGQPFFTTRGDRGSGLGVGICMRIVEEHGGSLTYQSREGAGTRARVELPLLRDGGGS
jgi:signal transduction histidine kinase